MRYTRYNYKKKGNKNKAIKFILSFLMMSIFVVGVGVLLANIIIYFLPINDSGEGISVNSQIEETVDNNSIEEAEQVVSSINSSFAIIQCGYFSKNENANIVFNSINKQYGAFIFNDGDKFKVLAGVYKDQDAQSVIDNLKSSGIEAVKFGVNLDSSNKIESQIAAICDGYIKILNTVLSNDVTAVKTEDFKTWISKLENIEQGENKEVLDGLKSHMNELATEINRENVPQEMEFLYKVLLNFNE